MSLVIIVALSATSSQLLWEEIYNSHHTIVALSRLTSLKIISCQIREGGSCSMLINKPISQSFSLSGASWSRRQPGSNPELEGNWRQGRHGVRLSKRAEGCVSKGLAEAHQTPTRSKGVGCAGGHLGGRTSGRQTEREMETERKADKEMWC